MMPVTHQPEYPAFDAEVRQPGLIFLTANPRPSAKDFNQHRYWSKAAPRLRKAYSGLCAYTTMYLVDTVSVDHFLPKTKYPHLAYEWDNYRLARQKINTCKGNSEEIVDPFEIKIGWFVLDLPSCLIRPGSDLDSSLRKKIHSTIEILRLNTDDNLVQERCDLLVHLAEGEVTMAFLDRRYPFLSAEVRRQGKEHALKIIFRKPASNVRLSRF